MKNALRWTLSLTLLALIGISCQQAADSPTGPSDPVVKSGDGDGTVTAQAGPSGPSPAGPSGGGSAGPSTGPAGPGTGGGSGSGGGGGGGGGLPGGGGGGGGTPTPAPTATPEPPPVQIVSVATGGSYEVCDPDVDADGCRYIYTDTEDFEKRAGGDAFILRTSLADRDSIQDPILVIEALRRVTVEVYFDVSSGTNRCPDHPPWAADGTGWEHGGSAITIANPEIGDSTVFSDREFLLNAGETLEFGPNTNAATCTPPSYVPLMFWIRFLG